MNFLAQRYAKLTPYVPGEQPKEKGIVKLNTNESPFPPSKKVLQVLMKEAEELARYPDPAGSLLIAALAEEYQVSPAELFIGNGSDEILALCFQGFMENGVIFPEISYGFYQVFAQLYQLETEAVPLAEDLSIDLVPYKRSDKTIVIANPNAPTGLALTKQQLEELAAEKPERLVIVDEAYVDFGGESAISLTKRYTNLLIVRTFSKSRQLAGARLGFAIGHPDIIADLNRLKFSFNPYNVNRLTLALGTASLADQEYFEFCRKEIIENREAAKQEFRDLGFEVTDSQANFIFGKHPNIDGEDLYLSLKGKNIFVRWFDQPEIRDYLRITVGSKEQMAILMETIKKLLEESAYENSNYHT
ncbi:histidinol-phosphate transaminase [Enterococcus mediterraneensis]|uniref:histidinol-phosphate transaminase n=1 Tax=Enterococcus mediterraneensis TaxID=2364791 RepID=UPI000F06F781|nr:histidinol-phosphate transaminase [Enterococcus mediterraneensis]